MEQYNYSEYKNAYYLNIFHTLLIVTGRPYVHFFTTVILEVSSNSISSSSLLVLLPPSSTVLGDSVVCTCLFFFLTFLFFHSVRTTNLFGLALIICTLIPPIIHKHQNSIKMSSINITWGSSLLST